MQGGAHGGRERCDESAVGDWHDLDGWQIDILICGKDEQPVRVMDIHRERSDDPELVGVVDGCACLCTTACHRFVVKRGGREVPGPASSLRAMDDVVMMYSSGGNVVERVS